MGGGFFFRMPCLSLLKIAALTPAGWSVKIVDEKVEALNLDEAADLVGITAMTTTANRAYEIAGHFRDRGVPVVMGGMHVSCLPEEARQHCDSLVIGEAEGLWQELLADFERQQLKPVYDNQGQLPSLEGLPRPNWDLYADKNYLPVHFVETTRGCPIGCDFCAVTSSFGGKYRNRPLDDVLKELRELKPFSGTFTLKNCVFFVDDNIFSHREYARRLLTSIRELKLRWFGQASMNIARDPKMLTLCRESGCVGLFMGFESLSPETLASVGKRVNRPDEYLDLIQRVHEHGIGIDGSFVFGFDSDDQSVFERTLDFVIRAKLEVAYFSILTPYPGTRLYDRLVAEGRLLSRDWSAYDGSHVVYQPRQFTPDELLAGYRRTWQEAYSLRGTFRRLWGTRAWKNFFYPMNFGFRRSVRHLGAAELTAATCDEAVR